MQRLVQVIIFFVFIGFQFLNFAFATTKSGVVGVSDYRFDFINIDWWKNFNDPYLQEYILKTIENNKDVRIASLKSRQAYQNVKSSMANELPQLSLLPDYARIRTPGFDFNGVTLDATSTNIFAVPMFASYEADIFLKNHDRTKSAKKQYEATLFEEKAVYISTVSATATTYFNILKLDSLIELQQKIVSLRKEIFLLTQERNAAGLASAFDTTLSDKQYTLAVIELNELLKQRSIMINQLGYLIAEPDFVCDNLPRLKLEQIEYIGRIPRSIKSEVLIYRPDLMKAEAELEKARIDVRIARKEFLPSVPIIGVVGYNSLNLSKLFDWDSFLALIGVGLIQNIYTGGRKTAFLKSKKFKYQEMFENYKKVDLLAIQEVNDALCKVKYDSQKDAENIRKFNLESSNFALINEKYKYGIISYFDMIQFRENLLTIKKDLCNSKTQRLVDYIGIYKATAGAL